MLRCCKVGTDLAEISNRKGKYHLPTGSCYDTLIRSILIANALFRRPLKAPPANPRI